MSKQTIKDPVKFAESWYSVDEIQHFIARQLRPRTVRDIGDEDIPTDVSSVEFAEWFTKHMRRAMVKGIQVGSRG